jgi:hypothetical protein
MFKFRKEYNGNAWVFLSVKEFYLPSMFDSWSSLTFVRLDIFNKIKELGLPHTVETTEEYCQTANEGLCDVTQAVVFTVHFVSWKIRFFMSEHCPVPCILGVDFFTLAKVRMDFATRRYSFAFQLETAF